MILHARPIIVDKRVPRSSSAWAGPFHHRRRKQSSQTGRRSQGYVVTMPWGLRRFQETGQLHFLTFSCYKRRPNFANAASRTTFETSLEQARQRYGLCVYGYVVMPEHIHMLVNEPEQGSLSQVMQSLKQSVARTLALRAVAPFWQARYYDFNVYDFNVWSEHKFLEKLRYIHRNPVTRGLVARPEDWLV